MWYRRSLAWLLAVVSLVASAGCGDDAKSSGAGGWNGKWRIAGRDASATITVEQVSSDTVQVTSSGGSATGKITKPGRAEGRDESAGLGGTFVLVLEGDRLTMTVKATAEDGTAVDIPEIVFERVKQAPAASSGARDERLVGHWRHTQAHSSAGFSYALDIHLVLAADGSFESWSRDADGEGPRTAGRWKTEGKSLFLLPDGDSDWHEKGAYSVSDSNLLLTYGPNDKQIFERI